MSATGPTEAARLVVLHINTCNAGATLGRSKVQLGVT